MRVDVVDAVLAEPGIGEGGTDRRDRRRSVRFRAGAVEIVGPLAAAGENADDLGAAGFAASSDSSTSAAPPSASTKPSRSRENGFDAFCGGSFCVDSADSSEKRITASSVAEPSAPIEMARSHSPRRIASTPSWIAVAPDAQAVDSVIGTPRVPNRSAASWRSCRTTPRRTPPAYSACAPPRAAADSLRPRCRRGVELEAPLPAELDRRGGQEQRPAEIPVVEAGFRHRLERGGFGELVGEGGGALVAGFQEVDGAGDPGVQVLGRESGRSRGCRSGRRSVPPNCPVCRRRAK